MEWKRMLDQVVKSSKWRNRLVKTGLLIGSIACASVGLCGCQEHAERAPAWSPDGQRIAFECYQDIAFEELSDMAWEICTVSVDGSDYLRLTDNDCRDRDPAWSPDGERIVFSRWDGVFIMDKDGTNLTRLTERTGSPHNWSPDGQFVAYGDDAMEYIYIEAVDGSSEIRLTYGDNPVWSLDGQHIAFVSWGRDGNAEIYVIDPDGSNKTRLTYDEEASNGAPAWSPDGKRIAFETKRFPPSFPIIGRRAVEVMNSDGSARRQIAPGESDTFDEAASPAWSPDGLYIAFVGYSTIKVYDGDSTGPLHLHSSEIYLVKSDGTDLIQLTRTAEKVKATRRPIEVCCPQWSPDGQRLAFLEGSTSFNAPLRLWIVNSDGSNLVKLIPD
jgi:TolB protein